MITPPILYAPPFDISDVPSCHSMAYTFDSYVKHTTHILKTIDIIHGLLLV